MLPRSEDQGVQVPRKGKVMKVKTSIKSGGLIQHNETLVRTAPGLKVKTNVKAGLTPITWPRR